MNSWVKCITSHNDALIVGIECADLVNELAKRHGYSGATLKRFAEAVIGGIGLSLFSKNQEKINLRIAGSGSISIANIDVTSDAKVRGYVQTQNVLAQDNPNYREGPWGHGTLMVMRSKDLAPQPFIGTVELITGHLAKDLTYYWIQSEQIRGSIGIDIRSNEESVLAARGFFIQALPDAAETRIDRLVAQLEAYVHKAKDVDETVDPVAYIASVLPNESFTILDRGQPSFFCSCSIDRVERAILLLEKKEIFEIIVKKEDQKIKCEYCANQFILTADRIRELAVKK